MESINRGAPEPIQNVIARLDGFFAREDFAGAKAFLYQNLEDCLGAGDALSALSLYNEIMGFERQYGAKDAAVKAADAALALLEQQEMAVSFPAAMIVLNAATVYNHAGRIDGAKQLYDRAEMLFGRYYPAGDKAYAGLYNNRASVYLTPEEYPKAEYYYNRALGVLRRAGDVCDTAVTYMNLAGLCARIPGREPEAAAYVQAAVRTMEIPEPQRDGYYAYSCRKCAAALKELGFAAEEKLFTERADRYYAGH